MGSQEGNLGVHHIGLVCRSVEKADRFYRDFLGLKKYEPKTLPAALSRSLFGLDTNLLVLNYAGECLHIEIFVLEGQGPPAAPPSHICLETADLDRFLGRCRDWKVPIIRVSKGEAWITFIRDDDGNLFEIKEIA